MYHHSVGQNSGLMMNLSPDMSGRVPDEHRAALQAAGRWAEECYGADNTLAATSAAAGVTALSLGPLTAAADRVMLQEDQSEGERITAWTLLDAASGDTLGNGTAVGHKRIHLLDAPVAAGVTIELRIDDALDAPIVSNFGVNLGSSSASR